MKLRIIGAPDLVRAFARKIDPEGFIGREYPSRHPGEIRWYGDIDDRLLELVLRQGDDRAESQQDARERLLAHLASVEGEKP